MEEECKGYQQDEEKRVNRRAEERAIGKEKARVRKIDE